MSDGGGAPPKKGTKGTSKKGAKGKKGKGAAESEETHRCFHCQTESTKMMCCSQCHRAWYCGRPCQKKHWKQHKKACTAAVAAEASVRGVLPSDAASDASDAARAPSAVFGGMGHTRPKIGAGLQSQLSGVW